MRGQMRDLYTIFTESERDSKRITTPKEFEDDGISFNRILKSLEEDPEDYDPLYDE